MLEKGVVKLFFSYKNSNPQKEEKSAETHEDGGDHRDQYLEANERFSFNNIFKEIIEAKKKVSLKKISYFL